MLSLLLGFVAHYPSNAIVNLSRPFIASSSVMFTYSYCHCHHDSNCYDLFQNQ